MEKIAYGVLYVEDEIAIAKPMTSILSRIAEPVYVAADAAEGLELFKEHRPHVVISDIKMAGEDGIQLAARLKAIDPGVRVVITTAHSDTEYFLRAIEAGVDRFYLKPIDSDKLADYLQSVNETYEIGEKLKRSESFLEQYRRAIDAGTLVVITDDKGTFLYVNNKYCDVSGYSREELVGKRHALVRHPLEDSEKFRKLWETVRAKKMWRGRIRNKRKDGRTFIVDTTIVPILDENDGLVEYISLQTDITREIEQQEELERLQAVEASRYVREASSVHYAELVRGMPVPAVLCDADEAVLAVSKAVAQRRSEIALPETLWELFEERPQSLFDEAAYDLGFEEAEGEVRLKDAVKDESYYLVKQPCGAEGGPVIWYLMPHAEC